MTGEQVHDGHGSATSGTAHPDELDRLRELVELHKAGELTDEEFAAMKMRVLGVESIETTAKTAMAAPTAMAARTTMPAPTGAPVSVVPAARAATAHTPFWFWLVSGVVALGMIAAGYITGAALLAPDKADAAKEQRAAYDRAFDAAYDDAYDSAHERSYDDAYEDEFDAAKTSSSQLARARGIRAGATKGRQQGAVKGTAAARREAKAEERATS